MTVRALPVTFALCALAGSSVAQTSIDYPEGVPVTRMATPLEKLWMEANPLAGWIASPTAKNVTNGAPTGTVVAPGEYAPAEAIIMAWEGGTTLNNIQRQMIREITTTGDADVWLVFDDAAERDSVMPTLGTGTLSAGTNVSRVKPVVTPTNTIWLRDYGPRYVYEGGVRVISDHTYNVTSRTSDNAMPVPFGNARKHAVYTLPLRHGGGNYHMNSLGEGFATQLIANENTTLTQTAIRTLWQQHWGVNTTITPALSTSVDGTQHIDMWMQIIADRHVMISDFVAQTGTAQDNLVDAQAAALSAAGWTVTRLPARNLPVSGFNVHYTYTNVVMCNNLVLIPSYTNATITQYNAPALAAWQGALPGKTIVQLPCESLAQLAGVMHCIVMHMPKHIGAPVAGGLAPTAFLRTQRASATLTPGTTAPIRFISDDDQRVTGATIEASTNGGASWNLHLADIPEASVYAGTFNWTVPAIATSQLRVRVTVTDPDGRTGSDASPVNLTINAPACTADFASAGQQIAPDGQLTADDIIVFANWFFASDPRADLAGPGQSAGADGEFTADDLVFFVNAFFAGC
jgi:agmatine deiminase